MKHIAASQPKGLYMLFFTELWERFGFYTVQTILVLYMSKALGYSDDKAYLLYGAFSSMLFLTPVIGGYIADRYIGFRQSIVIGAVLFILGYGIMALPNENAMFLGLSVIIVANGFFKPNVSSIVGDLYTEDDPRRDGGFTLFYMGINIGALIPPLFAGALVAAYTWGSGFAIASAGMVVSLLTFLIGIKRIGHAGKMPESSPLHQRGKGKFYLLLGLGTLAAIAIFEAILLLPGWGNLILIAASLGIVGWVLYYLFQERPDQKRRLTACLILILLSVGFWSLYNQTFTSLMLFADRNMSKEFLGFTIDAEFTQFFNPFFIIVFSPFLSWLWVKLDEKGMDPSTPSKFALGILCMALGYLFLAGGIAYFSEGGMSSPWWLAISYLIQTLGELFLSPIGLAMVTRLAPHHLVGMMMGVWFLTNSAAFAIGGELAMLSDVPKNVTGEASLAIYSHAFFLYGLMSLALAVLSFALVPYLKKLIAGPHEHPEAHKR